MTSTRSFKGGLALFLVALLGAFVGAAAWLFVEIGKASRSLQEAELRLAAVRHVCGMIGTYVEKSAYTAWPRSWEDLSQGAEDGGYVGGWSPRAPRLQDLVIIDFDADLKTLQQQDAAEFTAVRLSGGEASTHVIGEIQGLLAKIRGPVEWGVPER